jgi:hypothetical protein
MKKLFVILASVFVFFGSNAFASSHITIAVFNADDTSHIQDWKNSFSGKEVVLEKFEEVQ